MLGSPFVHNYVGGVDASWHLAELLRTAHAVRATQSGVDAAQASTTVAEREVSRSP